MCEMTIPAQNMLTPHFIASQRNARRNSRQILVVEDAPELLELIGIVLRNAGHVVLDAGTGEEGLRVALRQRPDLILLDIELPGLDGVGVLRELRANAALAAQPVIALTAASMKGDRERLLAAGFTGYLAKPVRPARLVQQIEPFLHAPVLARASGE